MDKTQLIAALHHSLLGLEKTISRFTSEEFNRQPSPTEWSPSQVAEHLLILEKLAYAALQGETIPTSRPTDSKVALIKAVMEDDTKRIAPEIVTPAEAVHDPAELYQQLKTAREKLLAAVEGADLTEACMAFKHPGFGTLTGLEWICFTIYHMQRHQKQLERIIQKTEATSV